MKLIFCPYCQDVVKLLQKRKNRKSHCICGKSWIIPEED